MQNKNIKIIKQQQIKIDPPTIPPMIPPIFELFDVILDEFDGKLEEIKEF